MSLIDKYVNKLSNIKKELDNIQKVYNNARSKVIENIDVEEWAGNHLFQALFIIHAYHYEDYILGKNGVSNTGLTFTFTNIDVMIDELFEGEDCEEKFYLIEILQDLFEFYDYYEVSQMDYFIHLDNYFIDEVCSYEIETLDDWEYEEFFMINEVYAPFIENLQKKVFKNKDLLKSIVNKNLKGEYISFINSSKAIAEEWQNYKKEAKKIGTYHELYDYINDEKKLLSRYLSLIDQKNERVSKIVGDD